MLRDYLPKLVILLAAIACYACIDGLHLEGVQNLPAIVGLTAGFLGFACAFVWLFTGRDARKK